jgi:hypothetical protein
VAAARGRCDPRVNEERIVVPLILSHRIRLGAWSSVGGWFNL